MLDTWIIIVMILLMFGVAFIYSNLGLGGGMLYVPIMVFLSQFSSYDKMPKNEIVAISLFLGFLTGCASAYNHYKKRLVNLKIALLLGCATVPSAVAGAFIGVMTGKKIVFGIFAIILILASIRMFMDVRSRKKVGAKKGKFTSPRLIAALIASIGTGLLSGIFGVGGGLISVLVMLYILDMGGRETMGTSSFLILPTALSGLLTYSILSKTSTGANYYTIDYPLMLTLGLVTLVGSYFGSKWGLESLKTRTVKIIFISVMLIASVQMVYEVIKV